MRSRLLGFRSRFSRESPAEWEGVLCLAALPDAVGTVAFRRQSACIAPQMNADESRHYPVFMGLCFLSVRNYL